MWITRKGLSSGLRQADGGLLIIYDAPPRREPALTRSRCELTGFAQGKPKTVEVERSVWLPIGYLGKDGSKGVCR